jgi:hypothetical protein
MKRDSMVSNNDKIDLKNKLNLREFKIFECRKSKKRKKRQISEVPFL